MASHTEISRIVDGLLEGFGQGLRPEVRRLPRQRFVVSDVEFDVERLSAILYWWPTEAPYPCVVDEDGPAPIMFDQTYTTAAVFRGRSSEDNRFYEQFHEQLMYQTTRSYKNAIERVPASDIRAIVQRRLISFLAVRSGGDQAPTPRRMSAGAAAEGFADRQNPYLDLEVHTQESSLRIHYTPAYFIDWLNVFGSPTTPAVGWILPGRYKFAAMRGGGELFIDNANFDIPPTTAVHLRMGHGSPQVTIRA